MGVSFKDAYSLLIENGTEEAKTRYDKWASRKDLQDAGVIDFVTTLTHEKLFKLSRDDFDKVARKTTHPLGDITRDNPFHLLGIEKVEDLSTPWSFMQVFHEYLERFGRVPMWQELIKYLKTEVAEKLWDPYMAQLDFDRQDRDSKTQIQIGINWRWGNAYYSALREIDILLALRDAEIPLKYHILADALYAVDFWMDTRLISVYIKNPNYKDDGHGGRKVRPEEIFAGSSFAFDEFAIRKRKEHGKYWPVASSTVVEVGLFAIGARASRRGLMK